MADILTAEQIADVDTAKAWPVPDGEFVYTGDVLVRRLAAIVESLLARVAYLEEGEHGQIDTLQVQLTAALARITQVEAERDEAKAYAQMCQNVRNDSVASEAVLIRERDEWKERYERPFVKWDVWPCDPPVDGKQKYRVCGWREDGIQVLLRPIYLMDELIAGASQRAETAEAALTTVTEERDAIASQLGQIGMLLVGVPVRQPLTPMIADLQKALEERERLREALTCATCMHWTAATSRQHGACEQGITFAQINGDTPYNFGCAFHEPQEPRP